MSDLLNSDLINKITSMENDLREGLICFLIALLISLFSSFWTNFINYYWLLLIAGDFLIYSFIFIGKFSFKLNDYLSIGVGSIFTTNSLLFRISRIFLYGVLVQVIFFQRTLTFFNVMLVIFIALFLSFVGFNLLKNADVNNRYVNFYEHHEKIIRIIILISALAILGIMMRIYHIYSISAWDEGWYASITTNMFKSQNWIQPIYYDDATGTLLLFDKPPLMFILGSIGIALFGFTSIAIKWPMGVLSGLMGVAGYLIYDHQKRIDKSKFIPELKRDKQSESEFEQNLGPDEKTLKINDGKIVGLIFGLSMAVTWFLTFYARTAYLDAAIVAITAFTALFAVKAIDHWFYGNTKRAYIYIFLTALINMFDLLAKAWQGLIVGPSIAIYLLVKYYEYFIPRQNLYDFLQNVKYTMAKNTNISKYVAITSSIISILLFNSFIPAVDKLGTICYQDSASTCITYVPNISFNFFSITIDFWSLILAIFVYFAVVSFTEFAINSLNGELKSVLAQTSDTNESVTLNHASVMKKYFLFIYLPIVGILSGLIGALIGAKGFEFLYDRLYTALTEISTTYFTYDASNSNRLFYGQVVDGSIAVIFGGIITVLVIWILLILFSAVVDTIIRLSLKIRLFYSNFATKIVAEWSLLVPLMTYGIFLGYWTFFLLFQGAFFNRDTFSLLIAGIILSLLAYLIGIIYVDVLKYIYVKVFNNNTENVKYKEWTKGINKLLLFLTVMSIFIILSFIPFIAWVNYMDQYIVGKPFSIRLPGELVGVPNVPQPLSYSWLFFIYYINWRYTGKGSQYTVVESLGGLISPLFLACIPFLLTGIYALIKKRDLGTLLFYGSWTFVVLITFLPAKFQLNYYYLAIFFPYFGLTSYGLFWTLRNTKTSLNFKNMNEKLLLSIPILLLISISLLFPFFNGYNIFQNWHNLTIFIISIIFVVGGFSLCAILFTRSIPESFALAFIIFYLYENLINSGIGNTDTNFLIISAVLIAIPIFMMRERIPLSSGIFLFLIIMTPVSTTAGWVNYKTQDDDQFQQIAQFIITHQGNYNYSTWVYGDAGARYAMRYYLHGLYLFSDIAQYRNSEYPLSVNDSTYMQNFMSKELFLKFFVVTTTATGYAQPTTQYSASYKWLETNFILINPLLNKPSWQHVQLFANKTVLTQSELSFLTSHS